MKELETALDRPVPIYPYLTHGNTKSLREKLGDRKLSHEPLRYGEDVEAVDVDAVRVAERMRRVLLEYVPAPG